MKKPRQTITLAIIILLVTNPCFSQPDVSLATDSVFTFVMNSPTDSSGSCLVTWVKDSVMRDVRMIQHSYNSQTGTVTPQRYDQSIYNEHNRIVLRQSIYSLGPPPFKRDSIVYSYFTDGKLQETTSHEFDNDCQCLLRDQRTQYTYHENGEQSMMVKSVWDKEENDWIHTEKKEYTYFQNGLLHYQQVYGWNAPEASWGQNLKLSYVYVLDEKKRPIETTAFNVLSDSVAHSKEEVFYDSQGHIERKNTYTWNGSNQAWDGKLRKDSLFSESGRLLMWAVYTWDQSISDWMGNNMYVQEYDADDRFFRRTMYFVNPNETGWEWDTIVKIEAHYLDQGPKKLEVVSTYEKDIKSWVLWKHIWYRRGDMSFKSYDILCEGNSLSWQGLELHEGGSYVSRHSSVTGADSSYFLDLQEADYPEAFNFVGEDEVIRGQESLYTLEAEDGVDYIWWSDEATFLSPAQGDQVEIRWDSQGDATLSGIGIVAGKCKSDTVTMQIFIGPNDINEYPRASFHMYPVPVSDILFIENSFVESRLELVNLKGTIVRKAVGNEINVSGLDPAVYILVIRDESGQTIARKKLVKQ